jgi:hypothetical protein
MIKMSETIPNENEENLTETNETEEIPIAKPIIKIKSDPEIIRIVGKKEEM